MDMEVVRRASIAALLFLTLVLAASGDDDAGAAAAAASGDDDAPPAAAVEQKCHPLGDEPYMLVAFQNNSAGGGEIKLLAEQRSVSGFANRSGNWFYAIRDQEGKRHRLLPRPSSNDNDRSHGSRAEGLWNALGVLTDTNRTRTASHDDDDDDDEHYHMIIGMQTSGGDKIRIVAEVDQRYMSLTGFAQGFILRPRWLFLGGDRRLLRLGNGSRGRPEEVASSMLRALMNINCTASCW